MSTVVEELQAVLALKVKDGEGQTAFAERLARAANDMDGDDWEALDNDTQTWVNAAIEAISTGKSVPLPEGLEAACPAETKPAKAEKTKKAEKPGKAAKSEKPAKKVVVKDSTGRGPNGKFAKTDKITLVAEGNPFREGSKCHGWYGKIKDGATLEEAVTAGAPRHHIRWAHSLGHIKVG